jgi:hypothetical protein
MTGGICTNKQTSCCLNECSLEFTSCFSTNVKQIMRWKRTSNRWWWWWMYIEWLKYYCILVLLMLASCFIGGGSESFGPLRGPPPQIQILGGSGKKFLRIPPMLQLDRRLWCASTCNYIIHGWSSAKFAGHRTLSTHLVLSLYIEANKYWSAKYW